MNHNRVSRIRDRVERLLADDRPERLSELRELQRRSVDDRHRRKLTKSSAGIAALIDNVIPLMHIPRMRQGAPSPLETLRYQCWQIGFQNGVEVDERRDFQCVLKRWAQGLGDWELSNELPETDELAEAVVHRLRPSRFWKLLLGFVPIVGPIVAYRIDVALALCFHDLATAYFRMLRASGVRPLPDDFALALPPRAGRDRRKQGVSESTQKTVERFLAEPRTEEQLRDIRGMTRIGNSVRTARWLAGSSGMATNLIPGRHLRFHDIDIDSICSHWRRSAGGPAARTNEVETSSAYSCYGQEEIRTTKRLQARS